MKIQWPDEKIHLPNKSKIQKARREAAYINDRNACPLCFSCDLKVINANKTPECMDGEVKFIAVCIECQIKVFYYKKIEEI